jgi:glutamine amidotransferase
MKIVIVKYNAGNVRSVLYALERLGVEAEVTDEREKILSADKIIFPGVGEAASAMKYLRERKLDEVIRDLKQPVLGVCLGMQLLCRHSEENDTGCLGILPLQVRKFPPEAGKVPQIGWNDIYGLTSPLFKGMEDRPFVYFVHSYYVEKSPETAASAFYGVEYSAAVHKDNFYAVQFHPEKSAEAGATILSNFIREVQ